MQDEDVAPLRSRYERFFDDGEGVVDSRMHIASKRVGRFLRVEQQWLVEWRVIEPVAQRHEFGAQRLRHIRVGCLGVYDSDARLQRAREKHADEHCQTASMHRSLRSLN